MRGPLSTLSGDAMPGNATRCNAMQRYAIRRDAMRSGAVRCSVMRCCAMPYDAMRPRQVNTTGSTTALPLEPVPRARHAGRPTTDKQTQKCDNAIKPGAGRKRGAGSSSYQACRSSRRFAPARAAPAAAHWSGLAAPGSPPCRCCSLCAPHAQRPAAARQGARFVVRRVPRGLRGAGAALQHYNNKYL